MANLNVMILDYGKNQRKVNYIIKDGKYYAITSGQSNKVASIKENNEVRLLVDNNPIAAKAQVITDQNEVKALFEAFNEVNNNHFNEFKDIFVAVEFSVQ